MESSANQARDYNEPEMNKNASKSQLSAADGLYLLVVIAAAIIRISGLDGIPLSPEEAQNAFSAFQFLQPGANEISAASPAYTTLTSLIMAVFGDSDGTARLIPIFFGLCLVILPWLIRRRLGSFGAVTAAIFFAVSPLFAATSRSPGGDSIALFGALFVLVSYLRLREQSSSIWLYSMGGALGLGLASSPLFYSALLSMVTAMAAQRMVSPDQEESTHLERSALIKVFTAGAATLILLSTRFFSHLAGFGAAAQIFGDWLTQFSLQGDLQTLLSPFLVLGRYEVVLLPLGIIAIVWAVWRNHPLGTLFTYWILAGLILMMLQRGVLNNALILPLAGYLLLGLASNQLLRHGRNRWTWAVGGMIIFVGAIVLVNTARFLRVSQVEQQVANIWISLMAVAAALLFIYYFWSEHERSILQGVWLGILTLLFLYQWGTAWNLTHNTANDPREAWVKQATDDDVFHLVRTLQDISRSAHNSDSGIPLFSGIDSPILRWYLRDFDQAGFGETVPPGAQFAVIISPSSLIEPALGDDYLGGDFGMLRRKPLETVVSPTPVLDALRWSLFHESFQDIVEERMILWIRSDVVQNR